jgi:succinyl-CoA synthetase beta subunit
LDDVRQVSSDILGMMLVTPQTSAEGKLVNQVLVGEDVYYPGESETSEIYMSVLLNRNTGRNMIMYSTEGGMDIEAVAENTPELIFTEEIDPKVGLQGFQARKIAFNLGLSGAAFKEMVKFVSSLYKAYDGIDASLFEINPVLKTSDNKILAVDAKVTLDENGLFRHKDYAELRDKREEDPIDVEAGDAGLNFVNLDGNVGCMVNGAGLAMATMDIIKMAGGNPANFLDVGGTADAARVEKAFRIILQDDNVKAILVNIFGGIVRCDRVAQGIIDAYKNIENINIPIIVRLQGTNAVVAKEMIDNSGLEVHSAILHTFCEPDFRKQTYYE